MCKKIVSIKPYKLWWESYWSLFCAHSVYYYLAILMLFLRYRGLAGLLVFSMWWCDVLMHKNFICMMLWFLIVYAGDGVFSFSFHQWPVIRRIDCNKTAVSWTYIFSNITMDWQVCAFLSNWIKFYQWFFPCFKLSIWKLPRCSNGDPGKCCGPMSYRC